MSKEKIPLNPERRKKLHKKYGKIISEMEKIYERTEEPVSEGISFTKLEKYCPNHKQDDQKKCYCDITGKRCNKFNCPKIKKNWEENYDV